MAELIREGTIVQWRWGQGHAEGRVMAIHRERVTRQINGTRVTRNATAENPAYLIMQVDGSEVLKFKSEVSRKD